MSFVSVEFAILLIILLTLIIFFKQAPARKLILLAASCVFYAWWDWRFLGVLAAVTILDFYVSQFLTQTIDPRKRKVLLWLSIIINLGFLGFFKYFNFFIDTLNLAAQPLGWSLGTLSIILPIGISFYTFETISYVIDVYHGTAKPAKSLIDYAIFITFFPRLVAGPIMRASEFLPQLERGISLDLNRFFEGTQLFLRGMLKKLVIADNLAIMVDRVYATPIVFSSVTVWLAVAAYAIQILYDFWGYTDMARGIGRILGIELPLNFNLPYTAQSVTEFWNRWHISLSTWLRDYIFFPLRRTMVRRKDVIPDVLIQSVPPIVTMLLGGLWHGASWTFVVWGGLHGLYLALERLWTGSAPITHPWTSYKAWTRSLLTFMLISVTLVLFRSPDWQTVALILKKLAFVKMTYNVEWYFGWSLFAIPLVIVGGWLARRYEWEWPIFPIQKSYTPAIILLEALIVFFFSPLNISPFIYFQF